MPGCCRQSPIRVFGFSISFIVHSALAFDAKASTHVASTSDIKRAVKALAPRCKLSAPGSENVAERMWRAEIGHQDCDFMRDALKPKDRASSRPACNLRAVLRSSHVLSPLGMVRCDESLIGE